MKIQEFDYAVDLLQSVLWQYNDATNLISLLSQKQNWYTIFQSNFWQFWLDGVFNLNTAELFGVAVWSYILDLPLFVPVTPDDSGKPIWGFNEYDPAFPDLINTYKNFENGNFATQNQVATLTLEEQRFILRLRYYQFVCGGITYTSEPLYPHKENLKGVNAFLNFLMTTAEGFPSGALIWALDGLDMSMTYVFNFDVSRGLRYALVNYDLLPRPAGVKIKYVVDLRRTWGFNEYDPAFPDLINTYQNFENGNFYAPFI